MAPKDSPYVQYRPGTRTVSAGEYESGTGTRTRPSCWVKPSRQLDEIRITRHPLLRPPRPARTGIGRFIPSGC